MFEPSDVSLQRDVPKFILIENGRQFFMVDKREVWRRQRQ